MLFLAQDGLATTLGQLAGVRIVANRALHGQCNGQKRPPKQQRRRTETAHSLLGTTA